MKSFLRLLILLGGAVFAVVLTLNNSESVAINLYLYKGTIQISLLIFISMFIGALLAWLFNSVGNLGKTMAIKSLNKKLEVSEIELSNLRKQPMQDDS